MVLLDEVVCCSGWQRSYLDLLERNTAHCFRDVGSSFILVSLVLRIVLLSDLLFTVLDDKDLGRHGTVFGIPRWEHATHRVAYFYRTDQILCRFVQGQCHSFIFLREGIDIPTCSSLRLD